MSAEQVFSQLSLQVSELLEQLSDLRTTVTGDGPSREEAVLVDVFRDLLEDLHEQLNQALQAFSIGQRAAQSGDFQMARRALSQGHTDWLIFSSGFHTRLYTYERSDDLVRFGRTNKAKWKRWAHIIQSGLSQCQAKILQIENSLLAAWRACSESLAGIPVSIQTIGMGHEDPGASPEDTRSSRTHK